jgi:hypothetical protein
MAIDRDSGALNSAAVKLVPGVVLPFDFCGARWVGRWVDGFRSIGAAQAQAAAGPPRTTLARRVSWQLRTKAKAAMLFLGRLEKVLVTNSR